MFDKVLSMLLDATLYIFITIKSLPEILKREFMRNKMKHKKQKRNIE